MRSKDKIEIEQFAKEISEIGDDALIDTWIAHQDKPKKIPDIDLQKSLIMEGELFKRFGFEYKKVVSQKREGRPNA